DDSPRLDGEDFDGGEWPLGSQVALGNTLLELAPYSPPNAALKWSDDGAGLDYNPPPRLRTAERQTSFSLPNPPGDYEARPLPWPPARDRVPGCGNADVPTPIISSSDSAPAASPPRSSSTTPNRTSTSARSAGSSRTRPWHFPSRSSASSVWPAPVTPRPRW